MTISESYLNEVHARHEALGDVTVEILSDPDGRTKLKAVFSDRDVELRVMRDLEPAADGDVLFIGHSFSDIPRLLEAARSEERLSSEEAEEIDKRLASASPGPWTAFIESDGGQAGCDVIRVSESDNEPDMYLWAGPDFAPSNIFRFVATARQDIPALLAAVR